MVKDIYNLFQKKEFLDASKPVRVEMVKKVIQDHILSTKDLKFFNDSWERAEVIVNDMVKNDFHKNTLFELRTYARPGRYICVHADEPIFHQKEMILDLIAIYHCFSVNSKGLYRQKQSISELGDTLPNRLSEDVLLNVNRALYAAEKSNEFVSHEYTFFYLDSIFPLKNYKTTGFASECTVYDVMFW